MEFQAPPGTVGFHANTATHDISRTNFHVKHISQFAKPLEDVNHYSYLYQVYTSNALLSRPLEPFPIVVAHLLDTRKFRHYYYTGIRMISL